IGRGARRQSSGSRSQAQLRAWQDWATGANIEQAHAEAANRGPVRLPTLGQLAEWLRSESPRIGWFGDAIGNLSDHSEHSDVLERARVLQTAYLQAYELMQEMPFELSFPSIVNVLATAIRAAARARSASLEERRAEPAARPSLTAPVLRDRPPLMSLWLRPDTIGQDSPGE